MGIAMISRLLKHNIFIDMNSINNATLHDFYIGMSVCDWMDYVDNYNIEQK